MPILEPILQTLRIKKVRGYIKNDSIVVDLGCGYPPVFLNQISPSIKMGIGIDEQVPYSKKGNIETFGHKLFEEVKIESDTADCVTMMATLEHLKKPAQIVKEVYRILKPKGQLLVTVPSKKSKPVLEILARLNLVRAEMIDQHENYFDDISLEKLVRQAGFSQVNISYFEAGFNIFLHAIK